MFNFFRRNKQIKKDDPTRNKLVEKHIEELRKEYPKLPQEAILKSAKYQADWEMDTERLTEEDVLKLIDELKLPKIVKDLFLENEAVPIGLENSYRPPTEYFLMTKKGQDYYQVDTIIPFLCDGGFSKIYAYDTVQRGFLTFDIETPDEINQNTRRFVWDGIFVADILRWWENEIKNEQILEYGKALDLKWTKEILTSIEEELDNSTWENIQQWKEHIYTKYRMITGE
ncbi:MAG: hypothetical protein MK212_17590 [Saprospiraceae bacterium]|nr:hypothetical protein [Saprospiraceae bacterium]